MNAVSIAAPTPAVRTGPVVPLALVGSFVANLGRS